MQSNKKLCNIIILRFETFLLSNAISPVNVVTFKLFFNQLLIQKMFHSLQQVTFKSSPGKTEKLAQFTRGAKQISTQRSSWCTYTYMSFWFGNDNMRGVFTPVDFISKHLIHTCISLTHSCMNAAPRTAGKFGRIIKFTIYHLFVQLFTSSFSGILYVSFKNCKYKRAKHLIFRVVSKFSSRILPSLK